MAKVIDFRRIKNYLNKYTRLLMVKEAEGGVEVGKALLDPAATRACDWLGCGQRPGLGRWCLHLRQPRDTGIQSLHF